MKKFCKSKYIFLNIPLIILISLVVARGHAQDARTIISKSIDAGKFAGIETISELKIFDQKGRVRTREIYMATKTFEDDLEKRLIIFMAPADIKGTGMLIFDYENKQDDMWMYMPALRKTRRIVSSEKSKSFMGSEFSNADMAAVNIDDFSYELIGESEIQNTPCWKIKSTSVSEAVTDEYGYRSQELFIGKDDFTLRRSVYYDRENDLLKTLENSNIEEVDPDQNKFMARHMIMENHQNGRKSEIIMEDITLNKKLDGGIFTTMFLERQ